MKHITKISILSTLGVALTATANAEKDKTTLKDIGITGNSFLENTELILRGRLRAEYADQAARANDGSVFTLRHHFGFITPKVGGFSLLAEGEHTWVLSNTSGYSAFPVPGTRSVIGDPDNFDLNRLQLDYTYGDTKFSLGRQKITHAGQRFVGSVPWRQNDQTFDAVTATNTSIEGLTVTYSYANQVNRIFGTQAPAGALERWHGDVHLFRADYKGWNVGTASTFAYLMDFDNAVAASSNTYGLELKGATNIPVLPNKLNYLLTAAVQTDAGANADYEEYFLRSDFYVKNKVYSAGVGMEWMTGDGNRAFQFPLGTNHKFNGFADNFLTTPATGLKDFNAWVGGKCPLGVNHKLAFHYFKTDEGNNYLGYEIDYVAKKKLTDNVSVLLKLAQYEAHGAPRDVQRASLQLDYSF